MKKPFLSLILLLSILGFQGRAIAHGAKVDYKATQVFEIEAKYDSGTPMKNAQVSIYAPDNQAKPWKTGITDENGIYLFTPDFSKPGYWEVKVRQAGHGSLISIPINPGQTTSANTAETPSNPMSYSSGHDFTPLQKTLMIALGIWGLVGTALFFSRSKSPSETVKTREQGTGNREQGEEGIRG